MTRSIARALFALSFVFALTTYAHAAGTLAAAGSGAQPMRILDHHVEVLIDNGYVRTEVIQQFQNENPAATDAIYTLPLPEGAALSEMSVIAGDHTLHGEVVPSEEAARIYQEQSATGAQTGLAVKQGYQRFVFQIANVDAGEVVELRFAYYQSIALDHGVGRYVYPLEEGGTAEDAFWQPADAVSGTFSAHVELRSAFPVTDVRLPELDDVAQITQEAEGRVSIDVTAQRGLERDVVMYYRLPADLPGRVEVIPYRADAEGPGTFMMVLTPGLDLAPLPDGVDYVLVLDVSGSMMTKLATLKTAVGQFLDTLRAGDRVRIVKFASAAAELTNGWSDASDGSIEALTASVEALQIEDGTNLYEGVQLGLSGLDAERASAVVLVTDAVANEGLVAGPSFAALLAERDVRVFGFLMGNSANWPLMQLMAETSGGFYAPLSNDDDIAGQMSLARDKQTHEAMHDFAVSIDGVATRELTHVTRKVHVGDQVVIFGRYDQPGEATFAIDATITGKPQRYTGSFSLPAADGANPELERLWAYAHVQQLEYQRDMLLIDAQAAADQMRTLGVEYQLVTDETSLLLLDEATFAELGIDPNNQERAHSEEQARQLRAQGEPVDYSVAADPAFTGAGSSGSGSSGGGSPSGYSSGGGSSSDEDDGYGGGALSPLDAALCAALCLMLVALRRRKGLTA